MAAPTHNVVLTSKTQAGKKPTYSEVGAAWSMQNNKFNIQLNAGVVIDWRICETHYINLFPRAEAKPTGWGTPPVANTDEDPLPF